MGAKPLVHLHKGQVQPHLLHEEQGPRHYRYDDLTDSDGAGLREASLVSRRIRVRAVVKTMMQVAMQEARMGRRHS